MSDSKSETTPVTHGSNALTRRDKLACALADTVCIAFENDAEHEHIIPVWDWWRARFNETLALQDVQHDW